MTLGLIIIGVIILFLVFFYNSLKTLQVHIKASIQEIGNQLKRQSDLIPNLAESVKGFMSHEKDIFKMLSDARKMVDSAIKSNDPKMIDQAQTALGNAIKSISLIAESNPQIQSSPLVSNLMNELRDTSDKVMYARRTLIDLSADFNIKISTIPGLWIAPLMGFTNQKGLDTPISGEFLAVSQSDTTTPKVNLN
jgi:LemA protein